MKTKKMIICTVLSCLALNCLGGATIDKIAKASVPELSVYGEAIVEAEPDYVKIFGVIEDVSIDGHNTNENVLNAFSKLQSSIESIGLEKQDLSSTYFYESACNLDGQVILKTSLDFFIETDTLENLSEIIALVSNSEFTRVKSLSYELIGDSVYKEALGMAKQNALDKANSLTNMDEMEIFEIEEQCYYQSHSAYKDFVSVEDDLVEPIKVKARVKVTLCYGENEKTSIDNNLNNEDVENKTSKENLQGKEIMTAEKTIDDVKVLNKQSKEVI